MAASTADPAGPVCPHGGSAVPHLADWLPAHANRLRPLPFPGREALRPAGSLQRRTGLEWATRPSGCRREAPLPSGGLDQPVQQTERPGGKHEHPGGRARAGGSPEGPLTSGVGDRALHEGCHPGQCGETGRTRWGGRSDLGAQLDFPSGESHQPPACISLSVTWERDLARLSRA